MSLIAREYASLRRKPRSNYFQVHDCVGDDISNWVVFIIGPPGTSFEGGIYRALMRFPESYPMEPPSIQFTCQMYHPNIYRDGKVCISTLQCPPRGSPPEHSSEYWRPVLGAEQALLSVVSLLSDPNVNDPANQYAAQEWIRNREAFNQKCARNATDSKRSVPDDFIAPVVASSYSAPTEEENSKAKRGELRNSNSATSTSSSQRDASSENNCAQNYVANNDEEEEEIEYVYSDEEDGETWNMGDDDETDGGGEPRNLDDMSCSGSAAQTLEHATTVPNTTSEDLPMSNTASGKSSSSSNECAQAEDSLKKRKHVDACIGMDKPGSSSENNISSSPVESAVQTDHVNKRLKSA